MPPPRNRTIILAKKGGKRVNALDVRRAFKDQWKIRGGVLSILVKGPDMSVGRDYSLSMKTPNYITPSGLQKLKDELEYLMKEDRPVVVKTVAWAAGNGDRSENADYIYGKKRLREIDRRMGWLTKRIEAAQVVDPKQLEGKKVVFGATVTIEDEDGESRTYQIVGEDEIDTGEGKISWKSPIAKALLNKNEGDEVKIRRPKGEAWVEIIKLEYI